MPYVLRNLEGEVSALFRESQNGATEYLPADHSDVLGFIENRGRQSDVHIALQDSDADIARVSEDLINLLVKKNIIMFTELPEAVQSKLIAREKLRSRLGDVGNSPVSEGDTI